MDVDDRVTLNPHSHIRGQTGNQDQIISPTFFFFFLGCSDGALALLVLI